VRPLPAWRLLSARLAAGSPRLAGAIALGAAVETGRARAVEQRREPHLSADQVGHQRVHELVAVVGRGEPGGTREQPEVGDSVGQERQGSSRLLIPPYNIGLNCRHAISQLAGQVVLPQRRLAELLTQSMAIFFELFADESLACRLAQGFRLRFFCLFCCPLRSLAPLNLLAQ
jgi:hypothetical protein